jgi:hypothetical protein
MIENCQMEKYINSGTKPRLFNGFISLRKNLLSVQHPGTWFRFFNDADTDVTSIPHPVRLKHLNPDKVS